ncbi:RodZ domain-containing protein [Neisseriaceae bacterium B1]
MTQKVEQNTASSILSATEFGQKLRQHREQKGLSIGEVSERLKLPARQIEALETGQYEALPEPVFIRGFLRSYGRFLDINESELDQYLAHFSPPAAVYKLSHNTGLNYANSEVKKPFPTWIFGVLAAGVIGYGVYAWQTKSQSENAKQEQVSVIAASESAAAPASNLSNGNVLVKPMPASEIAASQVAGASQVATANNASGVATPVVAGEMVINTRYRTMLTVTNAQGEVLINQIVPGRSEHRFANGAPFEVRLGYAIGSTVTFGGENINIDAIRRGGKTAVFKVGEQSAASAAQ